MFAGKTNLLFLASVGVAGMASPATATTEFELSGRAGYEARFFVNDAIHSGQNNDNNSSIFVEPEFYWQWNNGDDGIIFKLQFNTFCSQKFNVLSNQRVFRFCENSYEIIFR